MAKSRKKYSWNSKTLWLSWLVLDSGWMNWNPVVKQCHNFKDTTHSITFITSCLNFLFSSVAFGLSGVMEEKTKFEPILSACTGNTDLVNEARADKSFSLLRKNDPRLTCRKKEFISECLKYLFNN